ncbi:hypothetical protein F1880_009593 [Penicillium rolfsii]|nr:hypothetical protein F1880_009593 [Penicillium rolfsii]
MGQKQEIINIENEVTLGTYLLHILLRAAVDIATGAALTEKAREDIAQRKQAGVSVSAADDCLLAAADGLCDGLVALVTVIRGHGKGGKGQGGESEDVSHVGG